LTVAIATWNRAALLNETLMSLEQVVVPHGLRWELIVVDNNSSDETAEVVQRYTSKLPIRYLLETAPGQSHARNCAIDHSDSDILLWTDDDVRVDKDWLSGTLDAFARFDADLVYGRSQPWWESDPPRWYAPIFDGRFALLDHGPDAKVCSKSTGYGLNHAIRRSALEQIGGYRTDMGLRHGKGAGGEDIDLFVRAHQAGLRVVYTPHAVVNHFIPQDRCKKNFTRSRVWLGSEDYFHLLRSSNADLPAILGIPRYLYRQQFTHLAKYVAAALRRDAPNTFFYELKLLQFTGLLRYAMRNRLRTNQAATETSVTSD